MVNPSLYKGGNPTVHNTPLALEQSHTIMHHVPVKIEEIIAVAEPACRQFGVRRLDAFGSTARGTAKETSDIDLLVEFRDTENDLTRRFFDLLHYLEDHLGCEVDLLTTNNLKNPYFRQRVLRERIPIYEG